MTESDPREPKIIVDEDWKAKAQAEKEAAQQPDAQDESAEKEADAKTQDAQQEATPGPMPEASFSLLATTLATQALAALGRMPGPGEEKVME